MPNENNQSYTDDDRKEINKIKRFIFENSFTNTSADVLDSIAKLIFKSMFEPKIVMNNEYAELAATGSNGENYRSKLGYHISNNYSNVRMSILNNFKFDIGEYFSGIKCFIEQIAIVYSLYARE